MKTYRQIPLDQKIISLEELKEWGYTHYMVNKLVDDGRLLKMNRKNYENLDYSGEESDYFFVHGYVPSGVVCLLSAASYYGLTSYRPTTIDVAISNKKRIVSLPDWPPMQLCYYSDARYLTGIEIIKIGRNQFRIYDIEKTVADVISFRNKIGIEETKEILTKYLSRDDRDINKLYIYAEKIKCIDILKTYLEVLL